MFLASYSYDGSSLTAATRMSL